MTACRRRVKDRDRARTTKEKRSPEDCGPGCGLCQLWISYPSSDFHEGRHYQDRVGGATVIFGEEGDSQLPGVSTLESMGLDPPRRELHTQPLVI